METLYVTEVPDNPDIVITPLIVEQLKKKKKILESDLLVLNPMLELAKSHGDFSENSELDSTINQLNLTQLSLTRINTILEGKVVESHGDVVQLGSKISITVLDEAASPLLKNNIWSVISCPRSLQLSSVIERSSCLYVNISESPIGCALIGYPSGEYRLFYGGTSKYCDYRVKIY